MYFWFNDDARSNNVALIAEGVPTTYATLFAQADAYATTLSELLPNGITRPLIVIETANNVSSIIAYFAALRSGWPMILTAPGDAGQQARLCEEFGVNMVLTQGGSGLTTKVTSQEPVAMHADLAVLLSTSGTTGATKLVRLSKRNLQSNAEAVAEYLALGATDRAMTTLPFHYSYGLSVVNSYAYTGAAMVLTDASLIAPEFWDVARAAQATSLALVPSQFDLLDACGFAEEQLPSLRYMTQAGGRLDPKVAASFAHRAEASHWQLFLMYGQTEASPRMSYVPPQDAVQFADTIGRAIPGGTFHLIDSSGVEVTGFGKTGELIFEGPGVMMGYAHTRKDLNAARGGARLATGDIAERLPNGYFRVTGRVSRFIKMFGLRISLDEVEQVLARKGVRAYASGTDEGLVVFVDRAIVSTAALNEIPKQLASHCGLPAGVIHVEALERIPLLASQKTDYRALLERSKVTIANGAHQTVQAGAGQLLPVLTRSLGRTDITLSQSFQQNGGDSLSYLEVQLYLAERLGQDAPDAWDAMPLTDLMALDSKVEAVPRATHVRIDPDLIVRTLALLAVITLHATSYPTGGGAYLLLILVGFSLARFQSETLMSGRILRTLVSTLTPAIICYYTLITAVHFVREPVNVAWFFMLGNFDDNIRPSGIVPYWFIAAYVQIICAFSLLFLAKRFRTSMRSAPFVVGLVLAGVFGTMAWAAGVLEQPAHLRHRHPLMGLEFVMLGWCVFYAKSTVTRAVIVAVLALVYVVQWNDAQAVNAAMVGIGLGAIIWCGSVSVPRLLAKSFMMFGSLSFFIYLAHGPAISVVTRVIHGSEPVILAIVIILSFVLAAIGSWLYDACSRGTIRRTHTQDRDAWAASPVRL